MATVRRLAAYEISRLTPGLCSKRVGESVADEKPLVLRFTGCASVSHPLVKVWLSMPVKYPV